MNINQLLDYTRQLLQVERFRDYCPNGLQVQGKEEVQKIVSGVTASMALLEAARAENADMVLVHHGYFWKNEDERIVGIKKQRIQYLLAHEMNLVAYHLPLDAHLELGNNAQLAKKMGIAIKGWAGEQNIVAYGDLPVEQSLATFASALGEGLNREAMVIGDINKPIKRVAWCTGAAQGYMETAIALGVDVFVSGEISEQTVHLANESGVAYIAAGHHATERYGVQALGNHLAETFGVAHTFIDINNPV
ncbi:MAG TPA: Nif3-like dinuclear metal center hexameric protein [Methylophilaceae bacterium]|jgi:dinuclear metal center YbgI/SA1388 family protein